MDIENLKNLGFMKLGDKWILPTFVPPNPPRIPPVLFPVPDDTDVGRKIWEWGPMWSYHMNEGKWVKEKIGGMGQHDGQDFACSVGTPVRAPCPGVVLKAGWQDEDHKKGYGLRVMAIARGRQFEGFKNPHFTLAHLSDITIKEDEEFDAGELLGLTGDTGNTSGPHLHVKFSHKDNIPFEVMYMPLARWQAAMNHI